MALCLSLLIGVGACSEEEIAYSAGEENKRGDFAVELSVADQSGSDCFARQYC